MKIKANGLSFDVISVTDDGKTLQIFVETEEFADLSASISKSDKIEILDEDASVASTISGQFIHPRLVITSSNKILKFDKKDDSVDKIHSLQQQITDLELALCEIYESMEV